MTRPDLVGVGRNVLLAFPIRAARITPECEHPVKEDDEPTGYVAWHEWAAEKTKTHAQKVCPHCGLYVLWELRGGWW